MSAEIQTRGHKICRAVAIALCIAGLIGAVSSYVTWNQYLQNLPRHPDPTAGRTHPRNIHGIVVYQTGTEESRLDRLDNVTLGMLVLAMLIGIILDRIEGKPWLSGKPGFPLRKR